MATLAICIVFFPVILLTGPARFSLYPHGIGGRFFDDGLLRFIPDTGAFAFANSFGSGPPFNRANLRLPRRQLQKATVKPPRSPGAFFTDQPTEKFYGHALRIAIHNRIESFFKWIGSLSIFSRFFNRPKIKLAISDFRYIGKTISEINWGKTWADFDLFRTKTFDRLQARYDTLLRTCMDHRTFCLRLFFLVVGLTLFLPFPRGGPIFSPAAGTGDAVRAATLVAAHRLGLDEPLLLEPGDRPVEGAWAQGDPGKLLDVLRQRVAVLRAAGQAGEDQDGGSLLRPDCPCAVPWRHFTTSGVVKPPVAQRVAPEGSSDHPEATRRPPTHARIVHSPGVHTKMASCR